jgi:hypothetical protein
MKDLVVRHGEKVGAIIVLALCGYWMVNSLNTYNSAAGGKSKVAEKVKQIETILTDSKAQQVSVEEYDKKVGTIISCCDSMQIAKVPMHLFWSLPEKGGILIGEENGKLGKPGDVKASASRGKVDVTWSQADVAVCIPEEFEVYRWVEKEGTPDKPYAVVKADWPVHEAIMTASGLIPAPAPAVAQPGVNPAGKGGALEVSDVKKDYTFTDNQVEPTVTYLYRVRTKARRLTLEEQFGKGQRGKIIQPEAVETKTVDDKTYWVTKLSDIVSATTPTNIFIFYKGSSGVQPHWKARITVMRWNNRTNAWDKGLAEVLEGDKIIGIIKVRDQLSGQVKVVEIDSGYDLVKVIDETRKKTEVRTVTDVDPDTGNPIKREINVEVEYIFKGIVVKDRVTEQTQEKAMFTGKEEDELGSSGGAAEPTPAKTGKETTPTKGDETLIKRTR